MTQDKLSFDELCALVDLPRRTVRYYIQRGLADRPTGETRGAYYTARHVEQLLTVKKWTTAGVSLEKIAELLLGNHDELPPIRRRPGDLAVWSHLHVAEGVELQIEPGLAGLAPQQVRALARGVMTLFAEVRLLGQGAAGNSSNSSTQGTE
jgi:DNA-binding transcriptional MerR regulator